MRGLRIGALVRLIMKDSKWNDQLGIVVGVVEPTPMMPRQVLTVQTSDGSTIDGLGTTHCEILSDET